MAYDYQTEKHAIFTEEGQRDFLKIRDKVNALLESAGAFQMGNVFMSGSTWTQMACVDRMVELGELKEIPRGECAGQHRVFVSAKD